MIEGWAVQYWLPTPELGARALTSLNSQKKAVLYSPVEPNSLKRENIHSSYWTAVILQTTIVEAWCVWVLYLIIVRKQRAETVGAGTARIIYFRKYFLWLGPKYHQEVAMQSPQPLVGNNSNLSRTSIVSRTTFADTLNKNCDLVISICFSVKIILIY